MRNASLSESIA